MDFESAWMAYSEEALYHGIGCPYDNVFWLRKGPTRAL